MVDKRTTIKDVAKAADVSIATVSFVLNGKNGLPEDTRRKVWDAANQLNYVPSQQARRLRNGGAQAKRQGTNLLMRICHLGRENEVGDRFDADMAQLFDHLANQRGYFTTTYRYFHLKGFRCPLLLDELIDGVLVASPHLEVIESVKGKVPAVIVDVGIRPEHASIPVVNMDMRRGLMELFAEVEAMGHSSAALVNPPPDASNFMNHCGHLLEEVAGLHGVSVHPRCRYAPEITTETHSQVMGEVAGKLVPEIKGGAVTLILCADIPYADTLHEKLTAAGIRIPEDVSMVSANSLFGSERDVARVSYDWEKLLSVSLDLLKQMIDGHDSPCAEYLVAPAVSMGQTLGLPKLRGTPPKKEANHA